jgi:hypothetical protein
VAAFLDALAVEDDEEEADLSPSPSVITTIVEEIASAGFVVIPLSWFFRTSSSSSSVSESCSSAFVAVPFRIASAVDQDSLLQMVAICLDSASAFLGRPAPFFLFHARSLSPAASSPVAALSESCRFGTIDYHIRVSMLVADEEVGQVSNSQKL